MWVEVIHREERFSERGREEMERMAWTNEKPVIAYLEKLFKFEDIFSLNRRVNSKECEIEFYDGFKLIIEKPYKQMRQWFMETQEKIDNALYDNEKDYEEEHNKEDDKASAI